MPGALAPVDTGGLPLPLREAPALAAAAETPEPLDPVLPSFRERAAAAAAQRDGDRESLETGIILAGLGPPRLGHFAAGAPRSPALGSRVVE